MYKIKFIPDYSLDEFSSNGIQHVFFNLFQRCPNLQVLSFHDKIDVSCVWYFSLIAVHFSVTYTHSYIQTDVEQLLRL